MRRTRVEIDNRLMYSADAVVTVAVERGDIFRIYISKSRAVYDHPPAPRCIFVFNNRQDFAEALAEIMFGEYRGALEKGVIEDKWQQEYYKREYLAEHQPEASWVSSELPPSKIEESPYVQKIEDEEFIGFVEEPKASNKRKKTTTRNTKKSTKRTKK